MTFKEFAIDTAYRCGWTFVQALLACLTIGQKLYEIDWNGGLQIAAVAALIVFLKQVFGIDLSSLDDHRRNVCNNNYYRCKPFPDYDIHKSHRQLNYYPEKFKNNKRHFRDHMTVVINIIERVKEIGRVEVFHFQKS